MFHYSKPIFLKVDGLFASCFITPNTFWQKSTDMVHDVSLQQRIEIPCLCQPSEEPTRLKVPHPRRNCLEVSFPFVKGFSVLQPTSSTHDVSLPFVAKHDLNTNIRANIPADTLVRVMANTRNLFIQCMHMHNGGRHLPDVIFKTV